MSLLEKSWLSGFKRNSVLPAETRVFMTLLGAVLSLAKRRSLKTMGNLPGKQVRGLGGGTETRLRRWLQENKGSAEVGGGQAQVVPSTRPHAWPGPLPRALVPRPGPRLRCLSGEGRASSGEFCPQPGLSRTNLIRHKGCGRGGSGGTYRVGGCQLLGRLLLGRGLGGRACELAGGPPLCDQSLQPLGPIEVVLLGELGQTRNVRL